MIRSPRCASMSPARHIPRGWNYPIEEVRLPRAGFAHTKAESRARSARARKPRTFGRESIRFLPPAEPLDVLSTICPDWSN